MTIIPDALKEYCNGPFITFAPTNPGAALAVRAQVQTMSQAAMPAAVAVRLHKPGGG